MLSNELHIILEDVLINFNNEDPFGIKKKSQNLNMDMNNYDFYLPNEKTLNNFIYTSSVYKQSIAH